MKLDRLTKLRPVQTADLLWNPLFSFPESENLPRGLAVVARWLYDKFKRTGSVQDDKKAMVTTTASVATDEAKERIDDLFAANHLHMHLNSPLANETHISTIARSNDNAHQVWSHLLEASAIY
ncbi:hypothetical protein AVEN_272584-1 [Araneus ventricosus]|uniref:Uncharacterized protein n=1 Tax=Araneus ventricosus TaxID=182803 RepID=A0A4Y2L9M9_ARAVE|nr:hypothetical protein AVEN_272584-1 [Araneus ventricosus]